jgi:acetoin utilization protein AcuB
MFVRDCMTRSPLTVRPESDPLAALALLKRGSFRRLPVVDDGGTLVGIVSRSDLEVFLFKSGSPKVTERQHRVEQVMQRSVVTVPSDCPLEEAASLMIEHKIGSLLVVEAGRLVGIITETDIFRQLAAVLGGGTNSLRLTVQVPDVPGQLAELSSRIAQVGGNISSVVAYGAGVPEYVNITLRIEGADLETILDALTGQFRLRVVHTWEA